MATTSSSPTHVVGIDFGTSNTAVAYAAVPTSNHVDIHLFDLDKHKPKTKTIVALDVTKPKGQQCIAFGDQVKNKFDDEDSFHSNVLIFEHFKMLLHSNIDECISHNGKSKPLHQVIGETLKYLVDRTIEKISSGSIKTVTKKDILWVLTVPAIWTWKAKTIMRNAMKEYAQIDEKYIIEALEPECASITLWQNNPEISNQSKTAMIVDIGGGTVDISVHKLNTYEKRLESKLAARGGDWGGRNIDKSLFEYLNDILKFDFTSFKCKESGDYFDLTSKVEELKHAFSRDFDPRDYANKNVNLALNYESMKYSIVKRVEEYKNRTKSKHVEALQKTFGVKIAYQVLYDFYMKILQSITKCIRQIIEQLEQNSNSNSSKTPPVHIDYIYLAGGMAEAKIIVDEIKNSQPRKQIAVLAKPQTAIVEGAVYYGLNQNIIKTRVSTFTYGISANMPFNSALHDKSRKLMNFDGQVMCKDCFLEIVKAGQEIDSNQVKSLRAPPTTESQQDIQFNILQTKKSNPKYSDESGVEVLASITIDISDCMHLPMEKRSVTVSFMFGATIIYVNAINESTGKQENVYISFDYTTSTNSNGKRVLEEETTSSKKSKSNPSSAFSSSTTNRGSSSSQPSRRNREDIGETLLPISNIQQIPPNDFNDEERKLIDKCYGDSIDSMIRDYKPKDFTRALSRARDVPQKYLQSYAELSKYLTEPFTTVEDKAKVIYAWITHNISYDVQSSRSSTYHNDPIKTFKERKGVCGGYAALFQAMMFQCEVPSTVKVSGRSKSVDGSVGSHAWSAVQLESGQYFLLDCTWGAGSTCNGIFERRFNPNFFFVNPKTLIATHLPDSDKWQFLDRTVSFSEYSDMPVITQHGINNGFTVISNTKRNILLQDSNRGSIVLQANPKLNWDAELKDLSGNSIPDQTFVAMKDSSTATIHYTLPIKDKCFRLYIYLNNSCAIAYDVKTKVVTVNDGFVTKFKGMIDSQTEIIHPLQKTLDSDKEWTFVMKNLQDRDLYFSYDSQHIPLVKTREFHVLKTKIPPNAQQISICYMEGNYWVTVCRYEVRFVVK